MRHRILVIALIIMGGTVSAQVTSRLGRFQVDKNQGCAPFTVTITDTNLITTGECTPSNPCLMWYTGGTSCPADAANCQNLMSYTYQTPGTYTLKVNYQSIGVDDIVITVDPNVQPNFEVYRCSGNDVVIKVVDNNYEQYVINWGDASAEEAIPFSNNAIKQHPYPAPPPASYNIKVRGRDSNPDAADNCSNNTINVPTLAAIPAGSITKLAATSPTSVQLTLTTAAQILYKLEIAINNATTFQVLQNVYQTNTVDVSNLLLQNNFYCFRLSAFDPCTGTNNYSNTICSQDFDVAFNNGVNRLSWRTASVGLPTVGYVQRAVATGITQGGSGLPLSPPFYDDSNYDCNVEYCYKLIANYGGGVTSTSLDVCGIGQKTITYPAIDDLTASVTNGATLTWAIDPSVTDPTSSIILRSSNGSPFQPFTNTTNTTLTDIGYTTEGAYCYQVNYVDQCQNSSAPGVIACPMRLVGTINQANVITLNWTKYEGWKDGVASYAVEKFNISGTLIRTTPVALDTFLVDDVPDLSNQVVSYRVVATQNTGTALAYSNTVSFIKEVALTFPTAFTPNNDNLNDAFTIKGQYVNKMNIRIFDRWGILVFASEKNEPWNGTREGVPMPESSYVWRAQITDMAGRTFSREGTLILIRN